MPSQVKPSQSASNNEGDQKHKQLNKEIRDMVSTITHGVTNFHKSGSPHNLENAEEEHGLSVITLAGTNTGATMKSETDEKSGNTLHDDDVVETLSTYVNSNFQAINNSIMVGGSYQANDPGVHMDISDFFTDHEPQSHQHHKGEKHGKKEKKKEKEASSKHEHHSSHSGH